MEEPDAIQGGKEGDEEYPLVAVPRPLKIKAGNPLKAGQKDFCNPSFLKRFRKTGIFFYS